MGIFDFFKRTKAPELPKKRLSFHEDDHGLVELTPRENVPQLQQEMGIVEQEIQKDAGQIGFSSIHVIEDKQFPLSIRRILPAELEPVILKNGFEKADIVTTGYAGVYDHVCKNTFGFGEGYPAIYYGVKDKIVNSIWMARPDLLDPEKLVPCLAEIAQKWNLILADWTTNCLVDAASKTSLEHYFSNSED